MKNKTLYLGVLIVLLSGCSSKNNIGLINNRLTPCPSSPNCISSCESNDSTAYVEPIYYASNQETQKIVKNILSSILELPNTTLLTTKDSYLHFEFRTFLGFVDDVEFFIKNDDKEIHIRSASRIGYYDFKKNHNRYIQIKKILNKALTS